MEVTVIVPAVHNAELTEQFYQQISKKKMAWNLIVGEGGENDGIAYNRGLERFEDGLLFLWDGETAVTEDVFFEVLKQTEDEDTAVFGGCFRQSFSAIDENIAFIAIPILQMREWGIFHEGLLKMVFLEYELRGASMGRKVLRCHIGCDKLLISSDCLKESCYILSRYSEFLQKHGYFNGFAEEIIKAAEELGGESATIACMENMVARRDAYWRLESYLEPVLILAGDPICYGVLNLMASGFVQVLEELGYRTELFDMAKQSWQELRLYQNRRFLAVVGFQTVLFSVYNKEQGYLLDQIVGYKMNFMYDHPMNILGSHLKMPLRDYYILTQDGDYAAYVNRYYPNISGAFRILTAGTVKERCDGKNGNGAAEICGRERFYGIVFIGSYHNYRRRFPEIKQLFQEEGMIARNFLQQMKRRPNQNAEKCLRRALEVLTIEMADEDFRNLLGRMCPIYRCMIDYYREKSIRILLDSGVEIYVFGESWADWPYEDAGLLRHPSLRGNETEELLQKSKISLNIMSGHKDGFTERIVNSMLCGAVVVTDKSIYIEEKFENGKELCYFDLEHLEELPLILDELLDEDGRRRGMAKRAYLTAREKYSRRKQAVEFLDIIRTLYKRETLKEKK